MSKQQIPLLPLTAIDDVNLRRILQAIYDELRLRRGETKNTDDRFVTKAELESRLADK